VKVKESREKGVEESTREENFEKKTLENKQLN
jgi:hypothetical protein